VRRKKDHEKSSGNVFADIGVSEPDEALAKAELARQIGELIVRRGLNQTAAAKLLGVDQPKVSALLRGRLSGFSTERLFRFLKALGRDVHIVIKPARRARTPHVTVRAARA
jgi:predicted XRE-type DNA-binding protein